MTVDAVTKALARIRVAASDPEIAHGLQDMLYRNVLLDIAAGNADPAALAAEALKVQDIEFPRWAS